MAFGPKVTEVSKTTSVVGCYLVFAGLISYFFKENLYIRESTFLAVQCRQANGDDLHATRDHSDVWYPHLLKSVKADRQPMRSPPPSLASCSARSARVSSTRTSGSTMTRTR